MALPTSQSRAASDKTAQARGQPVDRSSSSLCPWTGASKWGVGIRLERVRSNVTVRDGRVFKLVLKGPLQVPRALVWVQNWNTASRVQRSGPPSPEIGTAPTASRELGRQQPASRPRHQRDPRGCTPPKGWALRGCSGGRQRTGCRGGAGRGGAGRVSGSSSLFCKATNLPAPQQSISVSCCLCLLIHVRFIFPHGVVDPGLRGETTSSSF